mgnify:CR=1 FL=1
MLPSPFGWIFRPGPGRLSEGPLGIESPLPCVALFQALVKEAEDAGTPITNLACIYPEDGVVLIPSTDVNCLLPKEYEKDKVTTSYALSDPKGLVAPLEQGQKVGTLYVSYEGTVVGSTDLETLTAVEELPVEHP